MCAGHRFREAVLRGNPSYCFRLGRRNCMNSLRPETSERNTSFRPTSWLLQVCFAMGRTLTIRVREHVLVSIPILCASGVKERADQWLTDSSVALMLVSSSLLFEWVPVVRGLAVSASQSLWLPLTHHQVARSALTYGNFFQTALSL